MAQHVIKAEVFYDGIWNDISTELHEPSAVKIERGFPALGTIRPSKIEWTFEDPTDKWRPGSATSAVYGKVGRATPARITVDTVARAAGEASSFRPDQSQEFVQTPRRGRRWVDFTAEGVLARIGTWETPLRSAIYRNVSGYTNLVGYWALEDGRNATQLSNGVPGGPPGAAANVTFQGGDGPAGASDDGVLEFGSGTDSRVSGRFLTASSTAGWQFSWMVKLPALGVSLRQMVAWTTTNGYTWYVNTDATTYNLKIVARDGTVLIDSFIGFGAFGGPNQWITYRLKATVSAGTVTYELGWYSQGAPSIYGVSGTFAGSVGALSTWSSNGNTTMDGALLSHVYGLTTGVDDLLNYAAIRSFDGYVGETAAARAARLCSEESIAFSLIGSASDTMLMGRQPTETFLKLLEEIAATDGCLIYDSVTTPAVTMRTRRNLYTQAVALALTYPTDVTVPFNEDYDYLGVTNLVTVSQRDGGDVTDAELTGPMSVLPPPAGIGEFKGKVDVNVADESTLPLIAGWARARGSLPGARYSKVTIDLDGRPSLNASVSAVKEGDRITITGRGADLIDLIVLGIEEIVQGWRRLVTFTCAPATVLSDLGVYDDTARRYGSVATTLAAGVNTTAVAWSFTFTDVDDRWDTTAVPYDVVCAGERVRVTAMGAVAGAGPYTQAATVTRSINGVIKSQTTGASIQVFNPARYGL